MSEKLIPTEYNGKRILTTEQLAEIYETTTDTIKQNFKRNKERFEEGKHYYYLEGNKLKSFKSQVTDSHLPINKFASHLYLWTERGADRHCKILDTDKAWDQFDNLENTYFKVKENKLISDLNTQNQMLQLAKGTQMIASVVQGIQTTINDMQEFVKDSINAKDIQIEHTAEMIGLRSKNTMLLTIQLKEKLATLSGRKITATDNLYKNFKHKIFKKYKVFKWEDIPISMYNSVYADIDTIEVDDIRAIG